MRTIFVAAIALVVAASGALAQNPPANDGPNNKAINSKSGNNPGAPVAGANSFTEGQAKSRIESKGYTNVSGLKKDDKGVWRGTAMRDGKSGDVSLILRATSSPDNTKESISESVLDRYYFAPLRQLCASY